VARVAIILLNADGVRFSDDMSFRRQNLCESIPTIGVKRTVF